MESIQPFLITGLLCLGAVVVYAFMHGIWLREHTKEWVPTTAEVLKRIEGGDGPDSYLLEYAFDEKIYRVETKPWLVPVCTAEAGSRITVLVNPYIPHQCASAPRKLDK